MFTIDMLLSNCEALNEAQETPFDTARRLGLDLLGPEAEEFFVDLASYFRVDPVALGIGVVFGLDAASRAIEARADGVIAAA